MKYSRKRQGSNPTDNRSMAKYLNLANLDLFLKQNPDEKLSVYWCKSEQTFSACLTNRQQNRTLIEHGPTIEVAIDELATHNNLTVEKEKQLLQLFPLAPFVMMPPPKKGDIVDIPSIGRCKVYAYNPETYAITLEIAETHVTTSIEPMKTEQIFTEYQNSRPATEADLPILVYINEDRSPRLIKHGSKLSTLLFYKPGKDLWCHAPRVAREFERSPRQDQDNKQIRQFIDEQVNDDWVNQFDTLQPVETARLKRAIAGLLVSWTREDRKRYHVNIAEFVKVLRELNSKLPNSLGKDVMNAFEVLLSTGDLLMTLADDRIRFESEAFEFTTKKKKERDEDYEGEY